MYELAAFRAIQGIGAGGLFSLALAIIGDIVPPRERAKYQGYFLAVFGTSSVLGPVVGGFFAGADTILGIAGWRWVFYINVPIGLAALVVVSRVLHIPHTAPRPPHRLAGRARADRRPGAAADRRRAGPRLGLGLRPRSLLCYAIGVARPGRVPPGRAARTATRRCCRCGCSATGRSPSARPASLDRRHGHVRRPRCCCRCTCRSSRAPRRPQAGLQHAAAGARHHGRLDRCPASSSPGPAATGSSRSSARALMVVGAGAVRAGRRGHPAVADRC